MSISFKIGDPGKDFLRKRNVRTSRYEDYFQNENDSDLTVKFGDVSFPGHGFVFEDRCPAMYRYYGMDSDNYEIIADDEDCSEEAFLTILRFIYRGDIVFFAEDLPDVLTLAANYDMDTLFNRLTSGPDFDELWEEFAWSFLIHVCGADDEDDDGAAGDGDEDSDADEYTDDPEGGDDDDEYEDGSGYDENGGDCASSDYNGYDDDGDDDDDDSDNEYESDDEDDKTDDGYSISQMIWTGIEAEAEALIGLEGFTHLPENVLKAFIRNSDVKVNEVSLFNACLRWASAQCQERGWKDIPVNWRKVMKSVIHWIRFTQMSLHEFKSGPKQSGVLHAYEVRAIEQAIASGHLTSTDFDGSPRARPAVPTNARALNRPQVTSPPTTGNHSRRQSQAADRNNCKVCFGGEVAVFFRPCGHAVVCQNCSSNLTNCPVCRERITKKMRVFLS